MPYAITRPKAQPLSVPDVPKSNPFRSRNDAMGFDGSIAYRQSRKATWGQLFNGVRVCDWEGCGGAGPLATDRRALGTSFRGDQAF